VRAVLWAFDELPHSVVARARYANDVDIELSGMLCYAGDRTASLDCGFTTCGRLWFEAAGSQAALVCDDFVLPASEEASHYWINRSPANRERRDIGPCVQEAKMIENFSRTVESGDVDGEPPRDALNTVRVCCALAEAARTGRETPVS
jgi:predicted dehydrogenase